jgi:hypothetical protein
LAKKAIQNEWIVKNRLSEVQKCEANYFAVTGVVFVDGIERRFIRLSPFYYYFLFTRCRFGHPAVCMVMVFMY